MKSHIMKCWLFSLLLLPALMLTQACQEDVTPTSSLTKSIEKIETAYKEGETKIEIGGPTEVETMASPEIMEAVEAKLLAYQRNFESRYGESGDFSEPYWVGVIPLNDACPAGTSKIKFKMDNQDNGSSTKSGWTGSWYYDNNGNSWHPLCKVYGGAFTLMTLNTPTQYLVARLSNNKTSVMEPRVWNIYIDNEDDGNLNVVADVSPGFMNNDGTHLQFWAIAGKNTPGVSQAAEFPDLGFAYGVFGTFTSPVVGGAGGMGTFKTDDENKNNANQLYSVDWSTNVKTPASFVQGKGVDRTNDPGNTTFNIRRVR
ncbi:hypothetical protein [Dyadobacter sp. CY347]|uniref:hypothetical protein n=1 Tax=Dyadobacter sp. CY347 TaxID=2909336 RepID=UPI001F42F657|nr:hypothetical protein [Dyadobacter sp. CY347]MCF2491538.1 hypothetical protein [Dyadobacter sp. CY347]